MAYHRSRSLGVGAKIIRRRKSLTSICHCSKDRSISLTLIIYPPNTQLLHSLAQFLHKFIPFFCVFHLGFGLVMLRFDVGGCPVSAVYGRRARFRGLGGIVLLTLKRRQRAPLGESVGPVAKRADLTDGSAGYDKRRRRLVETLAGTTERPSECLMVDWLTCGWGSTVVGHRRAGTYSAEEPQYLTGYAHRQ